MASNHFGVLSLTLYRPTIFCSNIILIIVVLFVTPLSSWALANDLVALQIESAKGRYLGMLSLTTYRPTIFCSNIFLIIVVLAISTRIICMERTALYEYPRICKFSA